MIDDVQVGTLADPHRPAMGPRQKSHRPERLEQMNELLLASYASHAADGGLVDGTGSALHFCEFRYPEQAVT